MAEPILSLRGIEKRFESVVAVRDLHLAIDDGEFVTLLGPSGCGKSTTLSLIAGFFPPDAGEIRLKGRNVEDLPPFQRDIGVVFQDYALFPHMTVAQNVSFGLRMRGVASAEIARRVGEALDLVKLTGLDARRPMQLSGGQRQRVALARALVIRPTVLLLDEPLSNLDLKLREEMRAEIVALQKRLGITTVFVTHDQGEALAMSDRIAVMSSGQIEQIGRPVEIYERPANRFVADFIGRTNFLAGRCTRLDADGGAVIATVQDATLTLRAGPGVAAGGAVLIAIRPERARLAPTPPSGPGLALRARLAQALYLGARRECHAQIVDGPTVVVEVANDGAVELDPGADVWFCAPPESCLVLPAG